MTTIRYDDVQQGEIEVDDEEMRDTINRLDGMLFGLLTPRETAIVEAAAERGWCRRAYEGGTGLMGLSTVRANTETAIARRIAAEG